MNLLAVAHNYEQLDKKVCLVKPGVDKRFNNEYGIDWVRSRAGLSRRAEIVLDKRDSTTPLMINDGTDCVLVDEAQFLTPVQVEGFRWLASNKNIPVICYGLRSDFRTRTFPGSQRLLELADSIEEIKTICAFCSKKAIFNMRLSNGVPINKGPQVVLGADETYKAVCNLCYQKAFNK